MTDDPRYPGWKRIKTHDQYMDVAAKERTVIEAAKAWTQTAGNSTHGTMADLDLYEAVEALAAAEKTD